jgi:hypothetical protein
MLHVERLDGDVVLELVPRPPAPNAATLNTIQKIWAREQTGRTRPMFDGQLFSLAQRAGDHLQGFFVNYSWFIAQRSEPALYPILGIKPVSVSGVLTSPDGLVFGRRADHVAQDRGRWELVPSGGIDGTTLDPKAKLMEELAEETGCPPDAVTAARVIALVENDIERYIDICIEVETHLDAAALKHLHATTASDEYTTIEIVPIESLGAFAAAQDIVPLAQALMKLRGFIA